MPNAHGVDERRAVNLFLQPQAIGSRPRKSTSSRGVREQASNKRAEPANHSAVSHGFAEKDDEVLLFGRLVSPVAVLSPAVTHESGAEADCGSGDEADGEKRKASTNNKVLTHLYRPRDYSITSGNGRMVPDRG